MKKIKKLISIGSNCISANIIKSVGMREPGPVDNLNGVNVWKSQYLFSSEIKIIFFNLKNDNYKNISRTFSGVVVDSVGSVHFQIVP